jgi:hypothetical protein
VADLREQIDMTEPIARCLGIEEGAPCTDLATITQPVPLCTHHQMQVAMAIVPEMLASAASLARRTPIPVARDTETQRAVSRAQVAGLDLTGVHGARVYFVRNGDRVKIGYSTNLRGRLDALYLRPDAVLLLLVGGKDLEGALHRHFAGYRVPNTEWFRYTKEIKAYISGKLDGHAAYAINGVYLDEAEAMKSVAAADFRAGAEGEVVVSRNALLRVIEVHMGSRQAVHLAEILSTLHKAGAPAHWTVSTLRAACIDHGVPVRRQVKMGGRNRPGVRRDELAPA